MWHFNNEEGAWLVTKLNTQRTRITDQFQNCSLVSYTLKGFAFKAGCDMPGPRGTVEERQHETGRATRFGPGVKSFAQVMFFLQQLSRSKLPFSGSQSTPVNVMKDNLSLNPKGKSQIPKDLQGIPCRSFCSFPLSSSSHTKQQQQLMKAQEKYWTFSNKSSSCDHIYSNRLPQQKYTQ